MKRIVTHLAVLAAVGASLALVSGAAAQADPAATIATSCDRPNTGITAGLFANLNTQIPDPITSSATMAVADSRDPAVQGQAVRYDIDLPFPDLAGGFTPIDGITYGYFYLRSVVATIPIPAGLDLTTITPTQSPVKTYVTASRVGSNLIVRVQSPVSGSRIRINADAIPATPEVEQSAGVWVPVVMPTITVNPTVTAAPGTSIVWHPPSTTIEIKYNKDFGFFIGSINWNDLPMPCTPDTPSQVIASTLVGTPGLSVSKTADESSVVAGAGVHFHVTATNTGNVPLTGVVVTDAAAPGCAGSPGALAVGAHVTLDCVVTTGAGNVPTLSNTAGADSNETAAVVSNTVNVSVTPAGPSGVSGTVTESGSGSPVAGAFVAVLRSSDFSIAGGGVANGSGDFSAPVPAGSYFLYVIDPAGGHTAALFGAPTQVTVTGGTMVDADPALAATRGTVSGTVVDSGTNAAIPGALTVAFNGSTTLAEGGATANGAGQFALAGLAPGTHFVGFIDPAGAHQARFLPNSSTLQGSTPATVTAGASTTANASLPTQTPVGGGAVLSGTVTEAGTAVPLAGVYVMALRAADYQIVRAATTNAAGAYNLDVVAGAYKLIFFDSTGRHNMEWHDNVPLTGIETAASVTAPAVTNAQLDPNTGAVAGTIVDDPAATGVPGAWVVAIGPTGIAGGAVTAANGTYTLPGLAPGTYRATFVDPNGGRTQEYWNNSPTYAGATTFNITAANTTTINAALRHP